VIGGVIAGALAITGLLLALGQALVRRIDAISEKTKLFARSGEIVPALSGNDELADLDRAFQRMQLQVRERQEGLERYGLLAKTARDIIMFIRVADLRIVEANDAALRAYGYTREELLQLTAPELRLPADRADVPAVLEAIRSAGGSRHEAVQARKDGTTFPVEIVAQMATIGGEAFILNVVRDISERERARQTLAAARDQAMEASRLKPEFVATMSHEIRTPMNGVIGMTDLLLQTAMTSDQHEFATAIRESALALLTIINDILDFSKIEAGKLELEVIEFEPVRVIEGVADLLAPQAHAKRLSLMTEIDPAIPRLLLGDPGRLRQILINLLSNAVKFTDSGNVSVIAVLEERIGGDALIRISVTDTGIGMSKQVREKLFQPFTQADGSVTRRFGGTGLGLSIAKRLVEFMHGSIGIESKEGEGATFSFTAWFQHAPERTGQTKPSPRFEGLRALIVDDDPLARDILTRQITSWGMKATCFATATEALAAMRAAPERFEVAIIDLRMPEIDGLELGREIRRDARLDGTQLILITAFDDGAVGKRAVDAGFSAFLTKPIRQSQLLDCIISIMDLKETPRQTIVPVFAPAERSRRSGRVLVAEDNAVNQRVAQRQLERICSDEVVIVADGQEAVEGARSGDFALVFMDCQMPVMDGLAATRLIRKAEVLTGRHIPIVAMTANALEGDRDACLTAGMDDYVAKPIQFEELQRAVARWLPEGVKQ
jgi:PAS domain S-box-containing protein